VGNHILPQVLLRGYRIDKSSKKQNARIRVLTKQGVEEGKVKYLFQEKNFYSNRVERYFAEKYEDFFGKFLVKLSNCTKRESDSFIITKEDYLYLIRFFTIMWRRNDEQVKKFVQTSKDILDNPSWRDKMLPEYKKIPTEEIINNTVEEFKDKLFSRVIDDTNDTDPTVQKVFNNYKPLIIVNKTGISFPLHNKYASVINGESNDSEYPIVSFEPLSKDKILLFIRTDNYDINSKKFNIELRYVKDKQFIETLIRLYILDSAEKIVIDKTNEEVVIKRLIYPDVYTVRSETMRFKSFLKTIGFKHT
jgi:hypothetical protein